MKNPVIAAARRTAVGTAFKGTLARTEAAQLAVPVIANLLETSGVDRDLIDDVILAESLYGGGVIARYVAIEAGIPNIPGLALNRHCAGGLSAIVAAVGSVRCGDRAVIAGGVQSSSTAPVPMNRADPSVPWLFESHRPTPDAPADDMSITVGWNAAQAMVIGRLEQDQWALRSHQRAVAAREAGQFSEEIVPIRVQTATGDVVIFASDEHPRATTSLGRLAALPVLHPEIEGFSITAGNASGINDAAAAVLVMDAEVAAAESVDAMASIRAGATIAVPPAQTGLAVAAAVTKALARAGVRAADIGLWEINEAFAAVAVAATRTLGIDEDRVNPYGSGCSIGHPVAATGARMVTTLAHELRRRGGGLAVAAMCAGGGMASAIVLEGAP